MMQEQPKQESSYVNGFNFAENPMSKEKCNDHFNISNPFHANSLFLCTLKKSENLRFLVCIETEH